MNIPNNFSESLETVLGLKVLKFFDADSGWKIWIWDKHPGFATRGTCYQGDAEQERISGFSILFFIILPLACGEGVGGHNYNEWTDTLLL
jgi:hypothetical protein